MSELTDLLLSTMEPVTALMLLAILTYLHYMKRDLRRDIRNLRKRINRMEGQHLTDGGSRDEHDP